MERRLLLSRAEPVQPSYPRGCFCVLEGPSMDLDYLTLTSSGAALQFEQTFKPTHLIEGKWDCS